MNETQLTVAKLCHEMAKYLSILKFLEEDFKDQNATNLNELFNNIDVSINVLDFFRTIYTTTDQPQILLKSIAELYASRNIKLIGTCNLFDFDKVYGICGILYILMKSCKSNGSVCIDSDHEKTLTLTSHECYINQTIIDALNGSTNSPNAINVFALYTKKLLESESYEILLDQTEECLTIKLLI